MTKYIKCGGGGLPPQVITDMNAVLNKKFGTSTTYPSSEWADKIEEMTALPEESASGSIAHFTDGADTVPLKSCTLTLAPTQTGTGDPSPSNPRPITGVSSVNVTQTGKNLFDISKLETTNITVLNGEATGTGTAFNTAYGNGVDFLKFSSGQMTLTISAYTDGNSSTSGNGLRVCFYYTDGTNSALTFLNSDTTKTTKTLTSTSGKVIDYMTISFVSTGSNIWHVSDVQLECGTTATAFEPYAETLTPVSLGQTVYGGEVDVVGGELEVTHGVVDFSTLNWTSSGSGTNARWYCSDLTSVIQKPQYASEILDMTMEKFKPINYGVSLASYPDYISVLSDGRLISYKYDGNSPSGLCVYPLATPTTAQITPTEINSRYGVNNLWHDGNGDIEVEYRADIDLYVAEHS